MAPSAERIVSVALPANLIGHVIVQELRQLDIYNSTGLKERGCKSEKLQAAVGRLEAGEACVHVLSTHPSCPLARAPHPHFS